MPLLLLAACAVASASEFGVSSGRKLSQDAGAETVRASLPRLACDCTLRASSALQLLPLCAAPALRSRGQLAYNATACTWLQKPTPAGV